MWNKNTDNVHDAFEILVAPVQQKQRTVLSISASVHLADIWGQTIQNNGKAKFKFYI